ncbi:MAG: HEAT repeat domain-containing protein [Novipirellula sp. JB048]
MNSQQIKSAVRQFASADGTAREKARQSLVEARSLEVIQAVMAELVDPRRQVRWEAAKALSQIGEPVAALSLVHAMDDEDHDVAWVAAEGVAGMGEIGLEAVLSGLTRSSRSGSFYKVAHHALKQIHARGRHREITASVLESIEGLQPRLSAPLAAYDALQQLRDSGVPS